jgi:hypothetical protein
MVAVADAAAGVMFEVTAIGKTGGSADCVQAAPAKASAAEKSARERKVGFTIFALLVMM